MAKNRYNQTGKETRPFEDRKLADSADARVIANVFKDETLSQPDRRRDLMENLTLRQADNNLMNHRAFAQRILKIGFGAARVGRDLDDDQRVIPTERMLKRELARWHKNTKTPCGLPMRRAAPKRRRSWSMEHLAKFLASACAPR